MLLSCRFWVLLKSNGSKLFFENRIGVNFCLGDFVFFLVLTGCSGKMCWFGQARKGKWWMPWRQEARKDAISCEKLRGAAK